MPIVIDCGGSTRLKRILPAGGYGDMATLLDVHDLDPAAPGAILAGTGPLPPNATGSQFRVPGPFVNMSLMFQDASGTPFILGIPLPDSFAISSNLDQNVRGDFAPRGGGGVDLILTVYSTVADPLVEAKQHRHGHAKKGRRRYVVANAGAIQTVLVNDAPPPIFDATNSGGPPPAPPVAPGAVGPAGGPPAPAAGEPLYVSIVAN